MKKHLILLAIAVLLALPALALGEGAVLMVELPEEAQMIENVAFEDGDFIQTYQLADGVRVQMLRYAAFEMTLEDLAEGEWTGYTDLKSLEIAEVDGCPAQGIMLRHGEDAGEETLVYMIMVDVGEQKLLMTAVFPAAWDEVKAEAEVNNWLSTMNVAGLEDEEVG